MAKVFSVHLVEPMLGADPEAFEAVILEAARTYRDHGPGWTSYVVKADRGVRKGMYAYIHEFESVEARDRYFPTADATTSEEKEVAYQPYEDSGLNERWHSLVKDAGSEEYTDYVVLDP